MRIHWLICSTMTMGGLRNGVFFFVFVWCQFDHAFSPISLCHEWNHFPMNNIICVHSFGVYYAVHAVMHFYCAREFAIMCRFDGRTVCYVQLKLKSHYKRNSVRSLPTFEWERCTDEMTCSVFYFIFCLVVSHWQRRLTHQKVCVLCSFCSISKSAIRTNCCFERTAFWIHGWPTNRRRSSVSSSRMEKFELA